MIQCFGNRDGVPLFLRQDTEGVYTWQRNRSCASEYTREEAREMVADAERKNLKTFAIRVL
jgi:hypothetical protein